VIAPDLSEGSHRSYAVQWFIFALAVAVGWVLAVRKSIATRRAETSGPAVDDALPAERSGAQEPTEHGGVDIDELTAN
jgi:hypothetical protein